MIKNIFRSTLFLLLIITLLFIGTVSVFAEADLTIASSDSFTGLPNTPISIDDLVLTGTPDGDVSVKLLVTNGSLEMTTTTGLTFTGASTGDTLFFSGTFADINTALATLQYTRATEGTDTLEVSLVEPGEVFFADNGHLYEYITDSDDWDGAKIKAEALTRYGATGYLATITSVDENAFVTDRLEGAGWMGASDVATEGDWKWVTGPEAGTSFWSGTGSGNTVGGNYANWNTGEPNDSGNEDCGQFLAGGTGMWNDLPCAGFSLAGYVVEFGAPGDMPDVEAKNITILTNNPPTIDSFTPVDGALGQSVELEIVLEFSEPMNTQSFSSSISPCGFGIDGLDCATPSATWSNGDQTATIVIGNGPYKENTTYTYTVNTAQDAAGDLDMEDSFEITFTTEGDPYTMTEILPIPEVIYDTEATYYFSIDGVGEYVYISEMCGGASDAAIDDDADPKEFRLTNLTVGETYECDFGVQNLAGTSLLLKVGPFTVKRRSSSSSSSPESKIKAQEAFANYYASQNKTATPSETSTSVSVESNTCPSNQILTQNLRAPSRNGTFNSYTKAIVTEAKILQAHLNRLGFNSGPEDGIIGPLTRGAITRMQTFLGTKPDGYVGPITRGLMNSSCGSQGLQS